MKNRIVSLFCLATVLIGFEAKADFNSCIRSGIYFKKLFKKIQLKLRQRDFSTKENL